MPDVTPSITHAQSAQWVMLVPPALVIAALLGLTLACRGRLLVLAQNVLIQRARRGIHEQPDPALVYTPPIVTAEKLLLTCAAAALLILCLINQLGGLFVAVMLAGPATAVLIATVLWLLEQRYIAAVDRTLPAAVSRLAAMLAAGTGPQSALQRVADDLQPGPLRTEWLFILNKLGVPLRSGMRATAPDVIAALVLQTPSARHRALLGHLEIALQQPQDVLARRVQAAGQALYAAEQRRSAAATELAQMRYSGIAVGLAGLGMGVYLYLTQTDRFAAAYQGLLGVVIAGLVALALVAPVVAGVLLSRTDDIEY